ncbi:MAG: MBOAT family protein [Lachnospiraceae bacterium]|nr:MBOAT family protein [Lachnospiraceae bacterium]
MAFTSVNFLIFTGILIALYYILPHKIQWIILLVGSYVFYFFAGPRYLAFLLFTTITTYLGILLMFRKNHSAAEYLQQHADYSKAEKKAYKAKVKSSNRAILIVVLVLNFALLFFCKAMLVEPIRSSMQGNGTLSFLTLGLPMGLSFYMFQSMGYLIDVYRQKAEALTNPFKLALFTSFFPQLVQGPISQFEDLKETLFTEHSFDRRQVAFGLQRMLWGFFKKMVIADRIAVAVQELKGSEYTGFAFFILVVFFAIQIYADFSGGIDIAIGVAETLGIRLPENFLRPYFSKNVAEFWRRWHVTLMEWMKRYIFYPITVSKPMLNLSMKAKKKLGRFGMRLPIYIGSLLTWLATGIWHGFNLHFIVWGLLNCFVIVISEELTPLYQKFHGRFAFSNKRGYDVWQIIRLFILINLIQVTDLFENVGEYFRKVFSLTYTFNYHVLWDGTMTKLGLNTADYVILLVGVVLMFLVSVLQRKGSVRKQMQKIPRILRYVILIVLLFAVILFGSYGIGYNASAFIYNQF